MERRVVKQIVRETLRELIDSEMLEEPYKLIERIVEKQLEAFFTALLIYTAPNQLCYCFLALCLAFFKCS